MAEDEVCGASGLLMKLTDELRKKKIVPCPRCSRPFLLADATIANYPIPVHAKNSMAQIRLGTLR